MHAMSQMTDYGIDPQATAPADWTAQDLERGLQVLQQRGHRRAGRVPVRLTRQPQHSLHIAWQAMVTARAVTGYLDGC